MPPLPTLVPLEPDDSEYLIEVIGDTLKANLHGVLGVAILQGLLTGLSFAIVGLGSPFTWGLVAGFFAMLPIVGTFVVWGPASIWLATAGAYGGAIFVALWGLLVTGMADNVARPVFLGQRTNQHPILVFLSILGGISAFGPAGLVLGPLVVSVTIAVFKVLRRKASEQPGSAEPKLVPRPRRAFRSS